MVLHLQQTYDSLPWALGGDFNVVASLEENSRPGTNFFNQTEGSSGSMKE